VLYRIVLCNSLYVINVHDFVILPEVQIRSYTVDQ